jgi:hypothetical protein
MLAYPIELFNMQRGADWLRIHFADDELILYKLRGVCGDKYERLHHLNEVSSETWCKLKGWFSDGFSSISKPAVLGGLPDTKWSLRAEYLGLDEERRHECIVTQLGQEGHLKRRILSARLKQDASDADREAINTGAIDCVIHLAIGMLFPWDVYLYKPDGKGRWICDDESKCYDTPLPDPPLETPLHLLNSI